jgi:uncharacterized short protein YbdD (DUF466 family)
MKSNNSTQPPGSNSGGGSWTQEVAQAGRYLAQSFRLMVGLPNYDAYLAHMAVTHPDQKAMTYEEFFRERQQARYGGMSGRCC